MATTGRLQNIDRLGRLLAPLAGRQRGMPIEAEHWNTLVDVLRDVLEIDRAQENGLEQSLKDGFAAREHEHLGAVTLSWLAPDLQSRLTDARESLSVRATVADVVRRLSDTAAEVATLAERIETTQRRVDESAVDELARIGKLRGFEQRIDGLENLRGHVTTLSALLEGLQPAVATVLELREQLRRPDGSPIDVLGLDQRVGTLAERQDEALTGVDGRPLRMRDFEVELDEVKDAIGIGAGGGLEARIAALGGELEGRLNDDIVERLGEQQQAIDAELAQLSAVLDAKMENRVGGLVAQLRDELAESLDTATGNIAEQTDAKVGDLSASMDERLSDLSASVDDRFRSFRDKIVDDITAVVADRVAPMVLATVQERIDEGVAKAIDARLEGVDEALRSVDGRLSKMGDQLKDLDTRVRKLEGKDQ
ncbi:hypothetical protein [Actinomadura sp. HBU206391]|uniref:hypothetical protein n=1 Tax=Actinomadura sp. HBU206391 TaxID=2731692 RepID=UPI00164F3CB1|nr:hypothetical protein [Actinomadura sp. HBU206391]MBC6462880.1 hypothetical protein [Actinomadura sp. HBU206391]